MKVICFQCGAKIKEQGPCRKCMANGKTAPCVLCGKLFSTCNKQHMMSIVIVGPGMIMCKECMNRANEKKAEEE